MKKSLLIITIAFSALIIIASINVSAKENPKMNSSYWYKNRTVLVTKKQRAYLVTVKGKDWASGSKILKSKVLKKGQKILVKNGGVSWAWFVSGKGFKKVNHGLFWAMTKPINTKWFKVLK